MTATAPSPFGVRARILATVLVLAAIGMTTAGAAFTIYERQQAIEHVDSLLAASAVEFGTLADSAATTGVVDGRPLTVEALLQEELSRHVPTGGEELIGIIDNQIRLEGLQNHPAAHDDPVFVQQVTAITRADAVRIRQIDTETVGLVRYIAVPVTVDGDPQTGVFVTSVSLRPVLSQLRHSAWTYTALSLVSLVLVGLGGWFVAGRLLRPLALINDAARQTSHTDLSARIPVRGNDDVSALTRTVNSMLDRLERAFGAQQAFLDDAGHELRTPLTIVRGHLELVDHDSPEDIRATHALVIDELDRMARLVNDLIVLAQSGRPDFVRLTPVDLDELLCDIAAKVPALADRQWTLASVPNVVVVADAHRLTQALLQLTHNAVRHTSDHDEIVLAGRRDGLGVIELSVSDSGPGVPPEDRKRIFDRFGRAERLPLVIDQEESRSSGLGLSIVAGIAAAHGGVVVLDEDYTAGARFVLRLPLQVIGPAEGIGASDESADCGDVSGPGHRRAGSNIDVLSSLFQPYTSTTSRVSSSTIQSSDQESS